MTHVYFGHGEDWHLIENVDHFVRRWTRAMRRREFFPVRYGGREFFVNPFQINLVADSEVL